MKREKTRIAALIVVAAVAIALAVLQALAGEPRAVAPAATGPVADDARD